MLIIMAPGPTEEQCRRVEDAVRAMGYRPVRVPGADRTAICVTGNRGPVDDSFISRLPGVARCHRITKPFKLVSRDSHPADTVIRIGGVEIGGGEPVLVAGPGTVETEPRTLAIARAVKAAGARIFRARLWSERVGPYAFSGVGDEGLHTLCQVREQTGLPVVSEIVDPRSAERVAEQVDAVHIASRHMENEALLEAAAGLKKPVIVERGPAASVEEWLMAAEWLFARDKRDVILSERGIRTGGQRRAVLDLHAVPVVRQMSHLPVLVDPSRAVGDRGRIRPLARAALAAGASGVLLEVHTHPDTSYTNPLQTADVPTLAGVFRDLVFMSGLERLAEPGLVAATTSR